MFTTASAAGFSASGPLVLKKLIGFVAVGSACQKSRQCG